MIGSPQNYSLNYLYKPYLTSKVTLIGSRIPLWECLLGITGMQDASTHMSRLNAAVLGGPSYWGNGGRALTDLMTS